MAKRGNRTRRGTRSARCGGFALILVLVLIATATVLGLSYLSSATVRLAGSRNLRLATRAQYLAESGLEHALWMLRVAPEALDGSASDPLGPYLPDDSEDSYTFYAEPVAGRTGVYIVTSTAQVESVTRTVSAQVKYTSRYRDEVLSHGPSQYWRLGETWGSRAYDAMGNDDGTYQNGVTKGIAGAIPHSGNYAAEFDGSNDYIDLDEMDIEGQAMTLLAWAKADDWDCDDARIISKATGTAEGDHYWMVSTVQQSGGIRLRYRLDASGSIKTLTADDGPPEVGKWFFVAAVYDGSRMKLYKDGVLVGERSQSGSIRTSGSVPAWIGGNPSGETDRPWDGVIDEVTVYQKALTAEEIADLYAARLPSMETQTWQE